MPLFKSQSVLFIALIVSLLAQSACSRQIRTISENERQSLDQDPFGDQKKDGDPGDQKDPFSPEDQMTSVNDFEDSFIPNNFDSALTKADIEYVNRCEEVVNGINRAELEKQQALAAAAANSNLIPVRFSISTGDFWDSVAYKAYLRSILRRNHTGVSYIYIAPHNQAGWHSGPNAKHYEVNHTHAREKYISGEKCFYSVVEIEDLVQGEVKLNGNSDWEWKHMHYGLNYAQNPDQKHLSPRLFAETHLLPEPQIVPLYVADIRDISLNWPHVDSPILQEEFISNTQRGQEYELTLKEVFHLDHIFEHRQDLTERLTKSRQVSTPSYSQFLVGYEGAPQLIDNLLFGYRATILSTKYTPLVLDLGEKHIRTSSVDWGSFFNMANFRIHPDLNSLEPWNVSHMTAWLGGKLVQKGDGFPKKQYSTSIEALDESATGLPAGNFPINWQRVADDGFLVLPTVDGEVLTSEQLFGDQMNINGYRFANGFAALRSVANKNCNSDEIKDRYIGPWDGPLYRDILKIWVDRDRNGRVGPGEMMSLAEARVAAINSCQIVSKYTQDAFGNMTHLRSAFLLVEEDFDVLAQQEEILNRLETGKTSEGEDAEFRVMIDIFFQTRPLQILQNIEIEDLVSPSGQFLPEFQEELPPPQALSVF